MGTSTSKEGKEYFHDLDNHRKVFSWEDDNDGGAIELAFSKKKIEARKAWLREEEVSLTVTSMLNTRTEQKGGWAGPWTEIWAFGPNP